MRDAGSERRVEGVEVERDVHRRAVGDVRRIVERSADGACVELAQAARVRAGVSGLHGVFGADAVLRDARDVRHFEEARGDAGVRRSAALVDGIEVGMRVELNDVNRTAEGGEGFGDRDSDGVVAAGDKGIFTGAPLCGGEIAETARGGGPVGMRRQVASIKNFSGEVAAGFAGGVVAVAVVGETNSLRATGGAATERRLRVVGEAGENELGGGVSGEAAGEGDRHGSQDTGFRS